MAYEQDANFTPDAPDFKHLVLMNMQKLTNFPYIEDDFDALTNYGLLSKVVEYLNQVIANNNEQNALMTGLYNAYVSLQNYVNDYFDNLDVQEEINNKLDDMARDGSLTLLIKNYVDPIYQEFENEINIQITSMNNKIDAMSSGSPLVASSTSGMTDTTKVYVNTTDGYWYYYDGDSWEQGGIYETASYENELDSVRKNLGYDVSNKFTVYANAQSYSGYGQDIVIAKDTEIFMNLVTENTSITSISAILTFNDNTTSVISSIPLNNGTYYKTNKAIKKVQYSVATSTQIDTTTANPILKIIGEISKKAEKDNTIINNEIYKKYELLDFSEIAHNASLESLQLTDSFNAGDILEYSFDSLNSAIVTNYNIIFYRNDDTFIYETGKLLNNTYYKSFDESFVKIVFSFNVTTTANKLTFIPDVKKYGTIKKDIVELKNYIQSPDVTLYNSKILIMGDSISADYYGTYNKWVTDLIDQHVFNEANVTNNSVHATGFVATYQTDDDFLTRLQAVQNKNTYDIVVTFGGVNDFIAGVAWSDFTAAVDSYMSYLVNNFTQARLCILSPLRTASTNPKNGKYLTDYCDYIIQKAKDYCLPVLNLTYESGFCPFVETFKNMWTLQPAGADVHDGVHPTEEYEETYLAPMIHKFLLNLNRKDT